MGQSVPSIKAKMFCQMSVPTYVCMYVYFLEIFNVFLFIVPVTGQSKFKVIIKTLGSSTRSSCTYSSTSASLYWLFRSEEEFLHKFNCILISRVTRTMNFKFTNARILNARCAFNTM